MKVLNCELELPVGEADKFEKHKRQLIVKLGESVLADYPLALKRGHPSTMDEAHAALVNNKAPLKPALYSSSIVVMSSQQYENLKLGFRSFLEQFPSFGEKVLAEFNDLILQHEEPEAWAEKKQAKK